MTLHETFPLALAQPDASADEGPSLQLSARPRVVRLRRELPASTGGRAWLLELEVEVPEIDPERLLAESEDFLVEDRGGRQIGVVERVETGATGAASALLLSVPAGWFRRRRLRVDVQAIEALVPAERRLIVDETQVTSVGDDGRPS